MMAPELIHDNRIVLLSCIEFAKLVAAQYGIEWTDEQADSILWEHTGFPVFWPERELTPARNLERQLRRYIEEGPL